MAISYSLSCQILNANHSFASCSGNETLRLSPSPGKPRNHLPQMSHLMIKPTKWHVRPAKTQISLGIRPVWSEASLSAWRSYPLSAQRRLWPDWADAQADLSLRWAHSHFVGFVMRRLKWHSFNPGNYPYAWSLKPPHHWCSKKTKFAHSIISERNPEY